MAEENVCSVHRACKVISLSKAGFYHKLKQRDDSAIIASLTQNVDEHPQEGFWLSYYRFRNQGYLWNHKRVFRVYQAMGLSLRRKKKKRLPARVKEPLQVPETINDTWSIDFMSDALDNNGYFGLWVPLISEYGCHSKRPCNVSKIFSFFVFQN